jgi:hypothetical protein
VSDGRRRTRWWTWPGQLTILAFAFGVPLSFAFTVTAVDEQARYNLADELWRNGQMANASNAEVYHRTCRRCDDDFRAQVFFTAGPRTVELPEINVHAGELPANEWVPAPWPYDTEFTVLYDRDDPVGTRVMDIVDAYDLAEGNHLVPSIVAGALIIWTLSLVRPFIRHAREEYRRREVFNAGGDPGSAKPGVRGWRADLVLAAGLVVTGLGVLLYLTAGREVLTAQYLDEHGEGAQTYALSFHVTDNEGVPRADRVLAWIDPDPKQRGRLVELVAPGQPLSDSPGAGWHYGVTPPAPYDDFAIKYDPDNPDLAIAEADIARAADPAPLIVAIATLALSTLVVGGILAWLAARRWGERERERLGQLPPGLILGRAPSPRP